MVDRKFTRSRYIHQYKYHQINKGQFFYSKGIIRMYHKEGHPHRKDHWDQSQAIERPEDKPHGTKHLSENSQSQRQRTPYTQRVRERSRHSTKIHPFLNTM